MIWGENPLFSETSIFKDLHPLHRPSVHRLTPSPRLLRSIGSSLRPICHKGLPGVHHNEQPQEQDFPHLRFFCFFHRKPTVSSAAWQDKIWHNFLGSFKRQLYLHLVTGKFHQTKKIGRFYLCVQLFPFPLNVSSWIISCWQFGGPWLNGMLVNSDRWLGETQSTNHRHIDMVIWNDCVMTWTSHFIGYKGLVRV